MPEPIRPDTKNGKVLNLLPNVIFYGIFLLFYNSRSFFQTVVDPRLNHILYKNVIYIVIRKNFVRAPMIGIATASIVSRLISPNNKQ